MSDRHTKAAILDEGGEVLGRGMQPTGFKLEQAAHATLDEALAASGAPAVQDLAATFGCHTGPKAMGTGAFEYAGLKCSFHSNDPD